MAVLLVSAGTQGASARIVKTIEFTTALDTLTPIDVAPAGPSVDDSFSVYSHTVSGDVSGHTADSCVVASVLQPGIKQCEVDFLTTRRDHHHPGHHRLRGYRRATRHHRG